VQTNRCGENMKKEPEFENFDRTMRSLLKVPHSEIKAKLEAEKKAKKRKKSKVSSASARA
jgi:hypothetical protein